MKGKVTQSSIMSHRIAMDTMFAYGEKAIVIENDAVNCFDRILTHIAAAAFYRMGMTIGIISLYMNFVEGANHHVLLGAKPSTTSYSHSVETPIMGSGQGTGWAGPSWFAVADIILTALKENQPGMTLESPDGETIDEHHAEMSVDDSRQGINETGVKKYNDERGEELTLQEAATQANQGFERYLTLTGGRLAI